MKSLDNLRDYVLTAPSICSTTRAILVGYVDNIEREVADMVPLPVDADGVPIRAGDVLDGYGKTIEVVELRHGRSGWVLISRDGNGYADTFAFTHHASTIEDVLREFGDAWAEWKDGAAMMNPVETFAAKLRLAGDE